MRRNPLNLPEIEAVLFFRLLSFRTRSGFRTLGAGVGMGLTAPGGGASPWRGVSAAGISVPEVGKR